MPGHDSPANSQQARFETTHWSIVLEAGHRSSPGSARALEILCETYWYPLYAFARRRGWSAEDAEELTQAFVGSLLEKDFLRKADPERGRFRSYLLTLLKRFLASEAERRGALKRGGGFKHLSLDLSDGESRYCLEPADTWTPEKLYQRRWALTVLDRAMERLRVEYAGNGKEGLFDECQAHLTGSTEKGYGAAAERTGMTDGAFRVAMHRFRERYRQALTQEVAQTLSSVQDVESELRYLRSALGGDTPAKD